MTGELVYNGKSYEVDSEGFLLNRERWDEDFARGLAPRVQIPGPLTPHHWQVLSFIRRTFSELERGRICANTSPSTRSTASSRCR